MKPPFWEVTVSRQEAAGGLPTIESVNCFEDKGQAQDYGNKVRGKDSSSRVTVKHVEAAPTNRITIDDDLWVRPLPGETKTRRRSVPA